MRGSANVSQIGAPLNIPPPSRRPSSVRFAATFSPLRGAKGCANGLSIAMNHCGVLRKMTGFFERQEWGYWCFSRPRATRLPAAISALMTASLASPFSPLSLMTRLPSKPGASAGEGAVFIDGVGDARVDAALGEQPPARHPEIEVLAAMARRGMNEAGAGVVGDVVAGEERDVEIVPSSPDDLKRMRQQPLKIS